MTTNLLLLMVLGALALVLVLIVYLIDRLNRIEGTAIAGASRGASDGDTRDNGMGGLAGRQLWDAMTAVPTPGLDPMLVTMVRPRYETVLRRHVEGLFLDGVREGRSDGDPRTPGSTRIVETPRGPVTSWLPPAEAEQLHGLGVERSRSGPEALPDLRRRLDDACRVLFGRAGLQIGMPVSAQVMPADPDGASGADTATDSRMDERMSSAPPSDAPQPAAPAPMLMSSAVPAPGAAAAGVGAVDAPQADGIAAPSAASAGEFAPPRPALPRE